MLTITVLAVIAGNLMWSASARYHVTYQSASWQEALVAAEAGVDFAMAELRKRVTLDPNDVAFAPSPTGSNLAWTPSNAAGAGYRDNGHAFPADNRPFAVSVHPGEGNSTMRTRVYVDVPGYGADASSPKSNFARSLPAGVDSFMCEQSDKVPYNPENLQWYRIRALGLAGVSGPARPSPDARDNWLRRFSFVNDWRTAQPLDAGGPQVSRLVEVVAKPLTTSRHALVADRPHGSTDFAMNLREQDMVVDSYDSRKGPYNPPSNHGQKGNLAANGRVTGGSLAVIKGDAMTNQGTDILPANVSGRHRDDFFQELTPVTLDGMRPDWTGVTNLGTLDGTVASLLNPVASLDRDHPTRLKVNNIDLHGGKILNVNAPASLLDPNTPSYVKIYVQGDLKVAADGSAIRLADGVNAIIYFTGNMDVRGLGVINESLNAGRLLFRGIQPPADDDGNRPLRSIYLSTILDFQGSIYAPNHDLTLALQAAGPTLVSGGSDPGLLNANDRTAEGQINAARDRVNTDVNNLNAALARLGQANPLLGNPSSPEVTNAQNALAADQRRLSDLTVKLQSQLDDHLRGYNGLYGSFVARTIEVKSKTHVHYDEALRAAGSVNHYEVVNWFEDNVSRATVSW